MISIIASISAAIAAMSAAISVYMNTRDRKLGYKPQFEVITDEGNNDVLNIANLNPNYQSYLIERVYNRTSNNDLTFEKQLTNINNGLNILKVNFKQNDRIAKNDNVIVIKYRSVIDVEYEESITVPIDGDFRIDLNSLKGIVFK